MKHLRIGTRGSALARVQAEHVAKTLSAVHKELQITIETIRTTGDILYDRDLATIGGKGLFLKEIEEQLLEGQIDIGVHSMKDVPFALPSNLDVICVLRRDDPREALIAKHHKHLDDLPHGAYIGTCSSRRGLYLKHLRPDINVIPLRGNVETRIRQLYGNAAMATAYGKPAPELDAILLAYAGLKRLHMEHYATQIIEPTVIIPAVGQGALAVEYCTANQHIKELIEPIIDIHTSNCIAAERAFMKMLQGDCTTPIAAYAHYIERSTIQLHTMYSGPLTNNHIHSSTIEDCDDNPQQLGMRAANTLFTFL